MRNTVSSYQPGTSVSRAWVKYWKNRAIMFESVLAWLRVNHMLPSVSKAAITDTLGMTELSVMLPFPFFSPHVFRMKLVSLSHVSSILMTRFPLARILIILSAYYCLRTSALAELAYGLSFLVLTKLSLKVFFKICRTNLMLMSLLYSSLICLQTFIALWICISSFIMFWTVDMTNSLSSFQL